MAEIPKGQYRRIAELFRFGKDTLAIAGILGVRECDVANSLQAALCYTPRVVDLAPNHPPSPSHPFSVARAADAPV